MAGLDALQSVFRKCLLEKRKLGLCYQPSFQVAAQGGKVVFQLGHTALHNGADAVHHLLLHCLNAP